VYLHYATDAGRRGPPDDMLRPDIQANGTNIERRREAVAERTRHVHHAVLDRKLLIANHILPWATLGIDRSRSSALCAARCATGTLSVT
jgi:hypothetical protein